MRFARSSSSRRSRLSWAPGLLCVIAGAITPATGLAAAAADTPSPFVLDPAFGDHGKLLVEQGEARAAPGRFYALAESSGGEIFLADSHNLRALRPDGSPDARFGPHGSISLKSPTGERFKLAGIAVDDSGRALVAGTTEAPAPPSGPGIDYGVARSSSLVLLLRLRPDGGLDRRFGNGGALLTDLGLPQDRHDPAGGPDVLASSLALAGMTLDRLGRIWLTGSYVADARVTCRSGDVSQDAAFFARLAPDGSPDRSFAENGIRVDPRLSTASRPVPLRQGGIAFLGSSAHACPGDVPAGVGRLDSSGFVEAAFSSDGWRPLPLDAPPLDLAVDRFGRPVILMPSYASGTAGAPVEPRRREESIASLLRLRPDGSPDPRFGVRGRSIVRLPTRQGRLSDLATDGRGRVLLAGTVAGRRARSGFGRLFLTRLRSDGAPDPRFGRLSTGFGPESLVSSARLARSKGTILLAGPILSSELRGGRGFALARYGPPAG